MNPFIDGKEVAVKGWPFRTARLRHEWCDFLADPSPAIAEMRERGIADLFTFVNDLGIDHPQPHHQEPNAIAVLPITSYEKWWEDIGKKKRNQIRKAQKSGVELRRCALDSAFATAVEPIYNESPVRQGRKFNHYGQTAEQIQAELSSFPDETILIGAFVNEVMVGFMKLFHAAHALRVVHILALLRERDKCVMDALIGKAVELCVEHRVSHLHYGSWADSGIGAFRMKHGFTRVEVPRYFVPLSSRGRLMLRMNLQRPMRQRLPQAVIDPLLRLRTKWVSLRFAKSAHVAEA